MKIKSRSGYLLPALILLLVILTCNKDEYGSRDFPRLITLEASNFSEHGITFNAEIFVRGNHEILRYGFVWSRRSRPRVEDSDAEKVTRTGSPDGNTFSSDVPSHLIQDTIIYCRAFIVSSQYTVYGSDIIVSYKGGVNLGPAIKSITPLSGYCGDTLYIRGSNFSFIKENNEVKIGNSNGMVAGASDTLLSVVLPHLEGSGHAVQLMLNGSTTKAPESFEFLSTVIESISPIRGIFGDTVVIKGLKFLTNIDNYVVRFGLIRAEIISASQTELRVVVPLGLDYYEVPVIVASGCYDLMYNELFRLETPVIQSFNPDTASFGGQQLTIKGKQFSPTFGINEVFIDGIKGLIIEFNRNSISVAVPFELFSNSNVSVHKTVELKLVVAGQSVIAAQHLTLKSVSSWTRLNDFPGTSRHHAVAFSVNNKGYYGSGYSHSKHTLLKDFWEYDPDLDKWSQIADFPGEPRMAATAFEFNNSGYVGLGANAIGLFPGFNDPLVFYRDFYKYDPQSGQWKLIKEFKGELRHSAPSMFYKEEPFVGLGILENTSTPSDAIDFWKYNATLDDWIKATDFLAHAPFSNGFYPGIYPYIYTGDRVYHYNGQEWKEFIDIDYEYKYASCIVISGKLYIGFGLGSFTDGSSQFYEYSPDSGVKRNLDLGPGNQRWGSSQFVIKDKAYILGGISERNFGEYFDLADVWKLDPNR